MFCPTCTDVVMQNDMHGTETNLVCMECGYVAASENQIYSSDLVHDDMPQFQKNQPSLNVKYKSDIDKDEKRTRVRSKARLKYILAMKTCIQSFTSNVSVFESAQNIFETMVNREEFYFKQEKTKFMLAAGCVFHALRRHNMSVTIFAVCTKIGVSFHGMVKILKSISEETEPITRFDSSGIKAIINELNTMKDNPERMEKAMKLLNLLESMSMTINRQPHAIANTVAYLAYVCEQKNKKVCTPMTDFIKMNKLGLIHSTDMMTEVKKRIILMAKRLPWMENAKIEMNRYHKYIDDVLQNHETVLLLPANPLSKEDILFRQTDNLNSNNQETDINTDLPIYRNPKTDLDVLTNAWNKKKYLPEKEVEDKIEYPEASTSAILLESDLPESDLNDYIRSDREVEKIKEIKMRLGNAKNDKEQKVA